MPKVTVICYTRSQPWGYGHHPRGSLMQQRIRVNITRPLISTHQFYFLKMSLSLVSHLSSHFHLSSSLSLFIPSLSSPVSLHLSLCVCLRVILCCCGVVLLLCCVCGCMWCGRGVVSVVWCCWCSWCVSGVRVMWRATLKKKPWNNCV